MPTIARFGNKVHRSIFFSCFRSVTVITPGTDRYDVDGDDTMIDGVLHSAIQAGRRRPDRVYLLIFLAFNLRGVLGFVDESVVLLYCTIHY